MGGCVEHTKQANHALARWGVDEADRYRDQEDEIGIQFMRSLRLSHATGFH
jgi:hypothetical protein